MDGEWGLGYWRSFVQFFYPAATPQQADCASGGGGLVSQGEVEGEHVQTQPLNGVK